MVDTLETAQYFIFVTQVHFCAMYAVCIWDWLTSLPLEWRCIWRTRWTAIKFAYILCRYWVLAVVPYILYVFVGKHSLETCQRIFRIPVTLAMWNQAGAEVVLVIRTYAFFNQNPYMLVGLVCGLLGMLTYQITIIFIGMDLLPFVTPPFTSGSCFPVSKPHSAQLLGFFIAPLLFDTIMTSMTMWKAFMIRRRSGGAKSALIQTFLREGLFYFLMIAIANLVNGIFYLQPRQVISAINIPLSIMLSPLLACRMILDLRARGLTPTVHADETINVANYSPGGSLPYKVSPGLGFGARTQTPSRVGGGTTMIDTGVASVSDIELNRISAEKVREVERRGSSGNDSVHRLDYGSLEKGNLKMTNTKGSRGIKVEVEQTMM